MPDLECDTLTYMITRERDEVLLKMREVANNAQKLGVFTNANTSVQRACEIHTKLKDKKKWITTIEKKKNPFSSERRRRRKKRKSRSRVWSI